ncbi:hypothetical protein GCM10010284_34840 [Streptomyces rubiginosohelvolus]|uniref:Uncharacterized protein n=1 Tax=Streptomyces rubiginosohelvolus TaxID=67362 RepID=A0ABQ3BID9_9ACTN|nr:hypothetical protein GCM10010284_34840 [Streptomyces rubiginosohelvolus]GGZ45694.1 hypothetical protein GCM10010328_20280 [Streptomyces pluricolorescens]
MQAGARGAIGDGPPGRGLGRCGGGGLTEEVEDGLGFKRAPDSNREVSRFAISPTSQASSTISHASAPCPVIAADADRGGPPARGPPSLRVRQPGRGTSGLTCHCRCAGVSFLVRGAQREAGSFGAVA